MRRQTTHRTRRTSQTHSTTAKLAVSVAMLAGVVGLLAAVAHLELVAGLTVGLLAARTLRARLAAGRRWYRASQRTGADDTTGQVA